MKKNAIDKWFFSKNKSRRSKDKSEQYWLVLFMITLAGFTIAFASALVYSFYKLYVWLDKIFN